MTDIRITHDAGLFYCLPVDVNASSREFMNIGEEDTFRLDCNLNNIDVSRRVRGRLRFSYVETDTRIPHYIEGFISVNVEK